MKLTPIRPRRSDPVQIEYKDGTRLLFSYEQPVAAYVPGRGYLVTDAEVTDTTARRIRDWVKDRPFEDVPQADIFAVITSRPFVTK